MAKLIKFNDVDNLDDKGQPTPTEVMLCDAVEEAMVRKGLSDSEGLFMQRQLEYVEARSFDTKYAHLEARDCFATDTQGGEGATSLTFRSYNQAGKAQPINLRATDLPTADVWGRELTVRVHTIGTGYDIDQQEIASAQMAGMPLEARRAQAARRGYEEYINHTSFHGDAALGMLGLYSADAGIPKSAVAQGADNSTTWESKEPDEILADLNDAVATMEASTLKIHRPTELWLPVSKYRYLHATARSSVSDTTIAEFFLKNNGCVTSIKSFNFMDNAIPEGDHFILCNPLTNEGEPTVRLREPLPLVYAPVQLHGWVFEHAGRGRWAGFQSIYPAAWSIKYGI